MKLILTQRERLQSLGSFLVDELDSLIARIRGAWKIEHSDDGEHAHVHAESVSTGRVTLSDIATVEVSESQINNYDPPGLGTAGLLRLESTSVTPISITGIHVPQDESGAVLDGRTLPIENASQVTTFILESESTYSSPRNRFRTPAQRDPLLEAAPARIYLPPVSITLLTYNAKLARWIVHSRNVDDNDRFSELAGSTTHHNLTPQNWLSIHTLRLSFTSASGAISGFGSEAIPETNSKTIVNSGLYAVDILHQNTGSTTSNRVACPGGVRYRLHPREACEIQRTADGWRIVEKADQWVDITFAAGNFTTDSGTWTVGSGDQTTLAYQIDGNKVTVSFDLRTTSVAGAPTQLRIPVPLGRTIARTMQASIVALDAGVEISTAYVEALAGQTILLIYKNLAAAAWANATDTTRVSGQITFMVRDDCASISESHTDVSHGDTGHADADHSDVAHVDVTHVDTHGDTAHSDASHGDIAHVDSHNDVAHNDVAHGDVAHEDVAHGDVAHDDAPHDDVAHIDHDDVPPGPEHRDSPHGDSHGDTAHTDVAHVDTHTDVAHVDTHTDEHFDTAHSDGSHADTPHSDSHSDTPHSDTAHVDGGHGDTPHADSAHQDVGLHCDTAHSDV